MDIAEYWKSTKAEIDEAIEASIPLLLQFVQGYASKEFMEVAAQSVQRGKRFRGMLTCLMFEALGGKEGRTKASAIEKAVAVEYIHAASLVLDDFIDRDFKRRGQPAVWTVEGVEAAGAALITHLLLAFGGERLSRLRPVETQMGAGAIFLTVSGAIREFSGATPDSEDVIALKTGALFGLACSLGVEDTHGSGVHASQAHEYGKKCGMAFQAADDLCDVGRVIIEGDEEIAQEIGAMEMAMERKISGAIQAIESFPETEHTQMLRQAPQFMVDMMLRESK